MSEAMSWSDTPVSAVTAGWAQAFMVAGRLASKRKGIDLRWAHQLPGKPVEGTSPPL